MPTYWLKQKIKFWDKDEFPLKETKVIVRVLDRFDKTVQKREYPVDETGFIAICLEFRWKHPKLRIEMYCVTHDCIIMDYKIKWHCDKPALMPTDFYIWRNLNKT